MQTLGIQVVNGGGHSVSGSSILLTVLLVNMTGVQTLDAPTSGTPNPIGPPATVTITLTTPSGQVQVSQASMTADPTNTGLFNYTYPSAAGDEHGYWTASFNFADGFGNVGIAPNRTVFDITGI